jgi:sugar lactone lactonase YvrE
MITHKTTSRGPLSRVHFTSLLTIAAAWCVGAVILISSTSQAQNLYVANANNNTIIKITPAGAQSTFASGLDGPYGMAFDRAGDLFVADHGSGNIYEFTNGVAANQGIFASGFTSPTEPVALAFDSAGDLFMSSDQSGNIYEFTNGVAANRGIFATLSGTAGIQGLAFDSAGDLFASQPGNNTITKITPGGTQSIFLASNLSFPVGLAFDSAGDLFEANGGSGNIYEFTNGVATNQSTFATLTSNAQGLAFDNAGDLFVTDQGGGKIYEFTNGLAANRGIFASGLDSPDSLAFAPTPAFSVNIKMFAGIILNNGQIGSNYLIQATANLSSSNWTTLTNVTLPSQPYIYIDYSSYTNSQQFYRVQPQ